MKLLIKRCLNFLCLAAVSPCALMCFLEKKLCDGAETVFGFWAHFFAILPGAPGSFVRRAFYCLTLDKCSLHCHIGFGSIFSHRRAVVEDHASLGNYTLIGAAHIGKNCEIASRVSIVSGKHLHEKDESGQWTPFNPKRLQQVNIGSNVWIGEGAVVMADVGEGSLVGAGAVVSEEIPANVVAVGNPAKAIKR